MPPLRIALVEDHALTRRILAEHLRTFPDLALVLVAPTGDSFLQQFKALAPKEQPQVVLMDIEMPGLSGIETTMILKVQYPAIDVLMLTVFADDGHIFQAIQAGASGYLLKDEPAEVIRDACLALQKGGAPMSPDIARRTLVLLRRTSLPVAAQSQEATLKATLSEREQSILEHLVQGDSYAQIADQLFISPHTVRTHIKNIYKKLHVHSRTAAVRLALEHKFFER